MAIIVSVRTRTRIELVSITSPIRSIQEPAISYCVIPIRPVPTMRFVSICLISLVLLPMVDPKWSLSLQFWQTLKDYCINFCMFLPCLNDFFVICLATSYSCLQTSQCVCYIRRVPNNMLLIWSIGRVSWTIFYHHVGHLWSLSYKYTMSAKAKT